MKLTAPCLLPNEHIISHIRLDSDRYYPIEFRMPKRLSSVSKSSYTSILVKKKSGVLSYVQDPHSRRSLLIQSGGSKSGSTLELIQSFTENPTLLAFAKYLCDDKKSPTIARYGSRSGFGNSFEEFCASVLHECQTEEKPDLLPLYLSLYFWITTSESNSIQGASSCSVWDIRLIESYYSRSDNFSSRSRLMGTDFVALLSENMDRILSQQ